MKTIAKAPGRRVYPVLRENGSRPLQEPGDYWKVDDGTWHCCTPNDLYGNLRGHHVEEHEDGTISVVAGPWGSNSILVSGGNDGLSWHGCIDKGVWMEF
jgi:hypothetical protein